MSKRLEDMDKQELREYIGKLYGALSGMIKSVIMCLKFEDKLLDKIEEYKKILSMVL